jgi:hypothetical protein
LGHLFSGQESAGGLAHVVRAVLGEGNVLGVPRVAQRHNLHRCRPWVTYNERIVSLNKYTNIRPRVFLFKGILSAKAKLSPY